MLYLVLKRFFISQIRLVVFLEDPRPELRIAAYQPVHRSFHAPVIEAAAVDREASRQHEYLRRMLHLRSLCLEPHALLDQ